MEGVLLYVLEKLVLFHQSSHFLLVDSHCIQHLEQSLELLYRD